MKGDSQDGNDEKPIWSYSKAKLLEKAKLNGHLHHILVLLGVVKSPTFAFTLLPEEIYFFDL